MRGKGEVAAAARGAMDARRILLVDSCNLSAAIRAAWLGGALSSPVWCVLSSSIAMRHWRLHRARCAVARALDARLDRVRRTRLRTYSLSVMPS